MASINPTSCQCDPEKGSGKKAYLKFEVTGIRDSDATTNKRYIDWKVTFQGTPYSYFYAAEIVIAGETVYDKKQTSAIKTSWKVGDVLCSGTQTINNDSAGNLSFNVSLHQMFYYGYSSSRWSNTTYSQWTTQTFTCSQLPRYANFTSNKVSTIGINYVNVTWGADASCSKAWYSLNGGSLVAASYPTYTIGNLQPNTDYNIRTVIRRSDSGLDTYSGYLYTKTAALPSSNTPGAINIGNNPSASITSMSNLEYWWYEVYDGSTKLGTSGNLKSTSGSCTINDGTKTTDMLSRHSSDNEWNLTYKFYCRSNGKDYTLTQRTAKCTIPKDSYLPSFNSNNISYEVTDQRTLDITGSSKKVIKGISSVKLKFTNASPNGQSSISKYTGSVGNGSYSVNAGQSNYFDFNNVEGDSYSIQVIDSRNKSATATGSYEAYINYSKPSITSANIVRDEGILANLKFNITGSFYKWSGLSTVNSIKSITYKYKEKGSSTWSANRNITGVTYSDNNFTINFKDNGDLLVTSKEYDVQVDITDQLGTTPISVTIPTGSALIWRDLANNRVGIGKKPDTALDVSGDIKVNSFVSSRGRLESADYEHQYPNSKVSERLDIAASAMTTNKPPCGDGFIKTFFWDNSGKYNAQIAISNNVNATKLKSFCWRGQANNANWQSWTSLLDAIYPIGSIYMSINSTDPGTLFGGTWVRLAQGKCIMGLDEGNAWFDRVGSTGSNGNSGNWNHTHNLNSHTHGLSSHTHNLSSHTHGLSSGWAQINHHDGKFWFAEKSVTAYNSGGSGTATGATVTKSQSEGVPLAGNTGGPSNNTSGGPSNNTSGGPSNNNTSSTTVVPPFYCLYVFKRTA